MYQDVLTNQQYYVAYQAGTERQYTGEFWDNKREGLYKSVAGGDIVFSSRDKFDSGTGWPSFLRPAKLMNGGRGCVVESKDTSLDEVRTEVSCISDGVHLGHLFGDGPTGPG